MNLRAGYILLQIVVVVGAALNAWLLVRNVQIGSWLAAVSATSAVTCVICFVVNWRRMAWFNREEKRWAEWQERRRQLDDEVLAHAQNFLLAHVLRVNPEAELERCYAAGICPDCGEHTLDRDAMACSAAGCGSRFTRDAAGKWGRA